MEAEEKEQRAAGRSLNVVHTLPRSMASVPQFLAGPLERVDLSAAATQVLVITADAETAIGLAESVLKMTGPGGVELLPITSARRSSRLFATRPIHAAAGSPRALRELIQSSHLKLESVKTVVLAWAEEILTGADQDVEALEAVMSELPKDAARIVVTSRAGTRVNEFAERYLRRAQRSEPDATEELEPVSLRYITVSSGSREKALRRLLDDLDPPSAAIVATSEESAAEVTELLGVLGYAGGTSAVRMTRGEVEPSTYAVVHYDAPVTRADLVPAVTAGSVVIAALVEPRELAGLREVAGGEVLPFTLSAPGKTARDRDEAVRRQLVTILDSGVSSREVLALEPLLERHDGIEIAAAALRLLEKERNDRKLAEVPPPHRAEPVATRPPSSRPSFGPPRDGARSFSRGAERGVRPDRGARPGGGAERGGRPDRGGRSTRGDDARPPRRSDGDRGKGRPPGRDR